MDQKSFDFPADEPSRRRRRGRRAPTKAKRAPATNLPLTDTPVLQRCGRCGTQQTVLGETALCAECGGIIVRRDRAEDETEWVQPAEECPREQDDGEQAGQDE